MLSPWAWRSITLIWGREHQGLHTGSTITTAPSASHLMTREVRGPNLARMLARHDLETEERERVDAGRGSN